MDYYKALILGIIEGLTEFLPVSSTGHLILGSKFLDLDTEKYASFNIIIQLGAILAVVVLYHKRFLSLLTVPSKDSRTLNLFHIAIAIVPVLAIGFVTRKYIKAHLYNDKVVVGSLIVVGIIMLIIEKLKPKAEIDSLDEIDYKNAFLIGISQAFALIPGVSRSGATMCVSMLRKVTVKTSADFSFLISVPVITIATVYEFLKSYKTFSRNDLNFLLVGFVVSFVVAIIAIKGFLMVLKKLSLSPFAIYRIAAGLMYYFFYLR